LNTPPLHGCSSSRMMMGRKRRTSASDRSARTCDLIWCPVKPSMGDRCECCDGSTSCDDSARRIALLARRAAMNTSSDDSRPSCSDWRATRSSAVPQPSSTPDTPSESVRERMRVGQAPDGDMDACGNDILRCRPGGRGTATGNGALGSVLTSTPPGLSRRRASSAPRDGDDEKPSTMRHTDAGAVGERARCTGDPEPEPRMHLRFRRRSRSDSATPSSSGSAPAASSHKTTSKPPPPTTVASSAASPQPAPPSHTSPLAAATVARVLRSSASGSAPAPEAGTLLTPLTKPASLARRERGRPGRALTTGLPMATSGPSPHMQLKSAHRAQEDMARHALHGGPHATTSHTEVQSTHLPRQRPRQAA
jgi:hypothetical protein